MGRPGSHLDASTGRVQLATRAFAVGSDAWMRPAVVIACVATLVVGAALGMSGSPAHLALAGVAALVSLAAVFVAPRWALVVAVFALVSYAADAVPGVAGSMAATGIVVVLLVGTVLRSLADRTPLHVPRAAALFAAYIAGLAITTAATTDRAAASRQLFDAIGFAVLVLLIVALCDSTEWVRRLAWSITLALGLLALLAVYQQVTQSYATSFGGLARVEFDGSLTRSGGPLSANYFGQVLAAGSALAAYLALAARSRRERAIALVAAAACVMAMLYTYSRGAMVGLIVGVMVAAVLRRVRLRVVAAAAVVSVLLVVFVLPPQISERVAQLGGITSPGSGEDESLRGRTSENLAAIDMWRAHPIEGVGLGNFEANYLTFSARIGIDQRAEGRSAHSLYLEALAEGGLIGSVPFFALLGIALWSPFRARGRLDGEARLLAEGAFVALATFLITAVTLHATFPRHMWIFLALALAAGRLGRPAAP